jgi:hypothetical protein
MLHRAADRVDRRDGPSAAINAVLYKLLAISDDAERAAWTYELRREYARTSGSRTSPPSW